MSATETKPKLNIKPLHFYQSVNLGCDPEFFFASKDGKTVGSEKVLPKEGIGVPGYNSKTVIDGVQAELNPAPSNCRESLAWSISACFLQLKKTLSADIKVVANPVVDVTQDELDSLSEGSRVFGCAPSTNVYNEGKDKTSKIAVDPKKYLKRSAGGHIHLGNYYVSYMDDKSYKTDDFYSHYQVGHRTEKALKHMPDVMVPMLDYLVGNTSVLLDRDPNNAERRKNYGRCGEYRIKEYGLEYRTLSNFWLRSYPLFSLVFGLARLAVLMVEQSTKDNDYIKAVFDAVPREDIIKAIQTNDFDLALENFKKLEEIIAIASGAIDFAARNIPLKTEYMMYFHHFVKMINEKGIEYWFQQDSFDHWTGMEKVPSAYAGEAPREVLIYNRKGGWETWMIGNVKPDFEKATTIDLNAKKEKKKEVAVEEMVTHR